VISGLISGLKLNSYQTEGKTEHLSLLENFMQIRSKNEKLLLITKSG